MQRTRADWGAAKARYIELGPQERSFERIAREYRVTGLTVRKHAHRDGWVEAAAAADQAAADAVAKQAVRSRVKMAEQNARIYGKLLDLGERRIDVGDVTDEFVARMLAQTSRDFRLDAGEATDNIAIDQVQEGFRVQQSSAYELLALVLEEGLKGRAILVAFRERLPVLVAERLALIGGSE